MFTFASCLKIKVLRMVGPSVELSCFISNGRKICYRQVQIINTRFAFSHERIRKLSYDQDKIVEDYGFFFVQSGCLWTARWKNRLLILKGEYIFIYRTEKGFTDQWIDKMHIDSNVQIYLEESETREKIKIYHIRLVKGWKTYNLCTNSEEERDSWITSLLTVISRNVMEYDPLSCPLSTEQSTNQTAPRLSFVTPLLAGDDYGFNRSAEKSESSEDISENTRQSLKRIPRSSWSTKPRLNGAWRFSVDNLYDSRLEAHSSALVTGICDSGKVRVFDISARSEPRSTINVSGY